MGVLAGVDQPGTSRGENTLNFARTLAEHAHHLANLAAYAHAFSHTTLAETVLRAGGAINVLPSHAYLEMDIRPFPGQTQDELDNFLLELFAVLEL